MLPAFKYEGCECQECKTRRTWAVTMMTYYGNETWKWSYINPFDSENAAQPMCSGECGTHGECGDAGLTCGHCDKCGSLCECDKCGYCGLLSEDCECCGYCGSDCGHCDECEEPACQCGCDEDSGGGRFGSIKVAPWVARGVAVAPVRSDSRSAARNRWGVDKSIDLCQAAADKYLLAGIVGKVVNPTSVDERDAYSDLLRAEGQSLLSDLTARLDNTFRGYLDMIVGGELRHHRAAGSSTLRGSRTEAWNEWHAIRSAGGTQALRDAADLFRDFDTSGYGGEAWAHIAETLLKRETGYFSPAVFVEQVWHLQHNGGSLFDKLEWQVTNRMGWTYYELNAWVLPAHGSRTNPWTVLLAVASDEVRDLFCEVWRHHNTLRRAWGLRTVAMPSTRVPMARDYYGTMRPDHGAAVDAGMLGEVHVPVSA